MEEKEKKTYKISNISVIILTVIISLLAVATAYLIFERFISLRMNATVTDNNSAIKNDIATNSGQVTIKTYNLSDYVTIKKVSSSNKQLNTFYKHYNIKEIEFKNLPAETIQAFLTKQQNMINNFSDDFFNNVNTNNPNRSKREILDDAIKDADANQSIISISAEIKDNVLYIMQALPDFADIYINYNYNYLAINLKTNTVLTVQEIMALNNLTRTDISGVASEMYNAWAGLSIMDKSGNVISEDEFETNKATNIDLITSEILKPSYNYGIYVIDGKLYMDYEKSAIFDILNWESPNNAAFARYSTEL